MAKQSDKRAGARVLGAGFAVSLATSPLAGASDDAFGFVQFDRGYGVAAEGACGSSAAEGKCGAADEAEDDKAAEGKCGG